MSLSDVRLCAATFCLKSIQQFSIGIEMWRISWPRSQDLNPSFTKPFLHCFCLMARWPIMLEVGVPFNFPWMMILCSSIPQGTLFHWCLCLWRNEDAPGDLHCHFMWCSQQISPSSAPRVVRSSPHGKFPKDGNGDWKQLDCQCWCLSVFCIALSCSAV